MLFYGAGEAGTGIGELIAIALEHRHSMTREEVGGTDEGCGGGERMLSAIGRPKQWTARQCAATWLWWLFSVVALKRRAARVQGQQAEGRAGRRRSCMQLLALAKLLGRCLDTHSAHRPDCGWLQSPSLLCCAACIPPPTHPPTYPIAHCQPLRLHLLAPQGRRRCFFMDSKGLVCASRTDLQHHKKPFAHDVPPCRTLPEAIRQLRPTALIGVSTIAGAFSPEVLQVSISFSDGCIIVCSSVTPAGAAGPCPSAGTCG